MKRIGICFLLLSACVTKPSTPFKEELIRNDDNSVIFKKRINDKAVKIHTYADSVLILSQEEDAVSIPFDSYLHAFNDRMDINQDGKTDLLIFGMPNMHGQFQPYVFLSDKTGKLHYRKELSIYNLSYDTVDTQLKSFYEGNYYTEISKDVYKWENDSLKLVRGASMDWMEADQHFKIEYYADDAAKPYKTIYTENEAMWDTVVFSHYPQIDVLTNIQAD